jgi:hypothetical protein
MTRVELGALSAAEAQQLLGEAVKGRASDALYAESGGNPFSTFSSSRVRRCVPAPTAVPPVACRSPASMCRGASRRR